MNVKRYLPSLKELVVYGGILAVWAKFTLCNDDPEKEKFFQRMYKLEKSNSEPQSLNRIIQYFGPTGTDWSEGINTILALTEQDKDSLREYKKKLNALQQMQKEYHKRWW